MEMKIAKRLLEMNPGMGERSQQIAHDLCEAGLSATASVMLLNVVYSPDDAAGRGQAARVKHFKEAVMAHYGYRLDSIRHDVSRFRMFLADMEEMVEMRDILKGEGFSIAFSVAFMFWELGLDADAVMVLIDEYLWQFSPQKAIVILTKAAMAVQAGRYMTLDAALERMTYGSTYVWGSNYPENN